MNKKVIIIIIIVLVVLIAGVYYYNQMKTNNLSDGNSIDNESAKRLGAKKNEPVFYQGLKIISTYEVIGAEGGLNEGSGRVIAFDKNTEKLIWETIVYTVNYDPAEEKDVQDVYITKLSIENDKLIVIDELNRRHELNPLTGENETFPPYTD